MTPDASSDQTPNRLRRFACMMYEAVLLFGVVFLAGYLMDTLTQSRNALELRPLRQAWLFVAIGAYFVLCWRRRGQTLPMNLEHPAGRPRRPATLRAAADAALHPRLALVLAGAALVWLAARYTGWPSMDMFIVAAPS